MAGGDTDVIDGLVNAFAALARVTRVGHSGAGQICRLANQQIGAITIGAVAEAMMLTEAGDASRENFGAIRGGFGRIRQNDQGIEIAACRQVFQSTHLRRC